ncbi:MAG: 1-hydroxycarotenoid 3,4-desaturase CrtD [Putridiphycobacter sp.]
MSKVAVIGSGIGGLASAIRFQLKGYQVTVLEQNNYPGGKLSEKKLGDYRFDAGPSLFTMPELIEELFKDANKNIKDYFDYTPIDPICHYFFEDRTQLKAYAQPEKFANEIAKHTEDDKTSVLNHLNQSQFIYNATQELFLTKSLHKIQSYLSLNTLISLVKLPFLSPFKTMHRLNAKRFKDNKNVRIFDRYATYNGSNPYKAPAILNLIPHLEYNKGAYFPKGGMISITNALYQLALDLGVDFKFNQKVKEIVLTKKMVCGVKTENAFYDAHQVVCNSDVKNVYDHLIPNAKKLEKVVKQERSSSALIFYWGINKTFPELDLHNIMFSENYSAEFSSIFEDKTTFSDPTVYIHISSKYCKEDAPEYGENWFVMINVPSDYNQNWEALITESRKKIIEKINRILEIDLEQHIEVEDILSPKLIESITGSYKGSLYGTSSNNRLSAFFRHPNFSKTYKGLYFCGGSVHPGGGIPLALSSAKIIDKYVSHA